MSEVNKCFFLHLPEAINTHLQLGRTQRYFLQCSESVNIMIPVCYFLILFLLKLYNCHMISTDPKQQAQSVRVFAMRSQGSQTLVSSPSRVYERYFTRSSRHTSSVAVLLVAPLCDWKEKCRVCLLLTGLHFPVPLLKETTSLRFSSVAAEQTGPLLALLNRGQSALGSLVLGTLPVAILPLLTCGVWLCVWRYSSSMSLPSFHLFHFFSISDCTWERKWWERQER